MYRRMKARDYFVQHVRQAYEKVYDEENNGYFYYNKLNSTSQWVTPKILLGRSLDPQVTYYTSRLMPVRSEEPTTSSRLAVRVESTKMTSEIIMWSPT